MRDAVGPFSAFEASQTHIQAGGTGAAGESSLGVSGVGTARLSLRRRPPKRVLRTPSPGACRPDLHQHARIAVEKGHNLTSHPAHDVSAATARGRASTH